MTRWLGGPAMPSAMDRVSVQRQVSAGLTLLLRDVVAARAARGGARLAEVAAGPGGVSTGVEIRQPGDIARKETSPFGR